MSYPLDKHFNLRIAESINYLNNSDVSSFEQLLSKHLDRLYNFALRLTTNQDDAKDLLQECCLTAFENFYQLKDIQKMKPWLFQIMHRRFINNYRRKKEPQIIDVDLDENLLADSDNFFVKREFENRIGDEVLKAFTSLPNEFREVILLADIEELSYRDISEIINIPMGTIASRLFRGHKLLKEKLKNYAQNFGY